MMDICRNIVDYSVTYARIINTNPWQRLHQKHWFMINKRMVPLQETCVFGVVFSIHVLFFETSLCLATNVRNTLGSVRCCVKGRDVSMDVRIYMDVGNNRVTLWSRVLGNKRRPRQPLSTSSLSGHGVLSRE